MNQLARYSALAAAAFLAACGGGSGGGSESDGGMPPTQTSSAEGFWTGKASSGFDVNMAVLDNGETWGIYASGGVIYGALHGQTTASNGTLTGSGRDFDLSSGEIVSSSYSGTYASQSNINVRLANGTTFTANYAATYDQPASLSALAGTYTGHGVATGAPVQAMPVTITSSGTITMPPSLGCAASGTVAPRAGGKNVFNLSVTFNGASCVLGNGATVFGVAYYESGKLLAMGLLPSKVAGFIFTGQK